MKVCRKNSSLLSSLYAAIAILPAVTARWWPSCPHLCCPPSPFFAAIVKKSWERVMDQNWTLLVVVGWGRTHYLCFKPARQWKGTQVKAATHKNHIFPVFFW